MNLIFENHVATSINTNEDNMVITYGNQKQYYPHMKKIYFIIIVFFVSTKFYSQVSDSSKSNILKSTKTNASNRSKWKKIRGEVFVTTGTANFLGDLGGSDRNGKDFSLVDLDVVLTRSAIGLGYRYKIYNFLNVAGKFNYLSVRGDDRKTKNIYRNNRNLNFKSNIFELSGRIEIGFESGTTPSDRYGLKKNFSRLKGNTYAVFFFAGIGGFYYNPKSLDGTALRPLHTEGQGLIGGPKQYSNYSVAIPIGIFYKYNFKQQFSIGAEFAWRKTFTDYIDDVSGVYYDKQALINAYGPLSAKYADPSLGKITGATTPSADGKGAQRGDTQFDSYLSFEITVGYFFKSKTRQGIIQRRL